MIHRRALGIFLHFLSNKADEWPSEDYIEQNLKSHNWINMLRGSSKLLCPSFVRRNHFDAKYLNKCEANYAPLSPLSPFRRTTKLYPEKLAYVYGSTNRTWSQVGARTARLASALLRSGIKKGDVISIISPNTPALYEAHFAVPGAEAVLHTINTRLDATTIAFQLHHSQAKVVLIDTEFTKLMTDVRDIMKSNQHTVPLFINLLDTEHPESVQDYATPAVPLLGSIEYEDFLKTGDESFELMSVKDEFDAIALNYTSGENAHSLCCLRAHYDITEVLLD